MKSLPIIGFDRYVPLRWLDGALAVAAKEIDRGAVVSLLANEIAGIEARSKTMIILNRVWLTPHPTLVDFASAGVAIYKSNRDIDKLPLHWGMALASHPFFASVADTIGKLLKLHGELTALQINRRLKELLGDRASILRATEAVLQSMREWGVICETGIGTRAFRAVEPIVVRPSATSMWLVEACVRAAGRSQVLNESPNLLFPLKLEAMRETDFAHQDRLRLRILGSGITTLSTND